MALAYQAEIADLETAGCRYIQIDDPLLTYLISDRLGDEVRRAGDDPDARLARYLRLTNDFIAERRPDRRALGQLPAAAPCAERPSGGAGP